jgi:putative NIF3 family GTP cyclohydrolase 1 type 2
MLCKILGLRNAEVLLPREDPGPGSVGLGRVGLLPAPLKLVEMAGFVKKALGIDRLRVTGREDAEIRRVAVVGGKGGSLIATAVAKGADLLVTGDIGHHEALEATASGLALIDGGHFHTERAALRRFTADFRTALARRGWSASVEFYDDEPDPMYFK